MITTSDRARGALQGRRPPIFVRLFVRPLTDAMRQPLPAGLHFPTASSYAAARRDKGETVPVRKSNEETRRKLYLLNRLLNRLRLCPHALVLAIKRAACYRGAIVVLSLLGAGL
jgi:hypothetical protein